MVKLGPILVIGIIGIFLFLLIMFIRQLILKVRVHYKLLKELFPEKITDDSKLKRWRLETHDLDFGVRIWYMTPIYYNYVKKEKMGNKALEYHNRLILINRRMGSFFLLYVLYIVGIFCLAYYLNS